MDEPSICWFLMLFCVMWRGLMHVKVRADQIQDKVDRFVAGTYLRFHKLLGGSGTEQFAFQSTGWVGHWYTILLFFASCLVLHEFYNVLVFDILGLKLLTMPVKMGMDDNSEFATWLRWLGIVAPCFGLVFFFLNVFHVAQWTHDRMVANMDKRKARRNGRGDFLLRNSEVIHMKRQAIIVVGAPKPDDKQIMIKYTDGDGGFDWVFQDPVSQQFGALEPVIDETSPWKVSVQEEMSLLVILMPAIFIMMALFAEIRCIQLFAGTGFPTWKGQSWEDFLRWHQSTEEIDMECAATFQFIVVAAFARLCSWCFSLDKLVGEVDQRMVNTDTHRNELKAFIESSGRVPPKPDSAIVDRKVIMESLMQSSSDHKFALTYSGLQGIGVYALVGALRSMLAIAIAFFCEKKKMDFVITLESLMDKLYPIYVFTTLICIYNWIVVSKLPDLTKKEALGKSATLKFMAARLLLLVGDGQKGFLNFLVIHQDKLKDNLPEWAHINESEAAMLHVVLLMILWCPGIVLWNLFFWTDRESGHFCHFLNFRSSFYNNRKATLDTSSDTISLLKDDENP